MIKEILEVARWAPSTDNSQPWRFEYIGDNHVRIHGFVLSETRDYKGNYTQFSIGCLLETLEIAASTFSCTVKVTKAPDWQPQHLIYDVSVEPASVMEKDPLADAILNRVTNRFPLSQEPISSENKLKLESSLPQAWSLRWYETLRDKLAIAKLMYFFDLLASPATAGIIEWNATQSKTLLPDESLGLDPLNLALARWIFKSPARIEWFMHRLGGAFTSAFLAFFIPSIMCGGHCTLLAPQPLQMPEEFVLAGRIFQRFWLEATRLGLFLQMESGPVIFSRYVRDQCRFTEDERKWQQALDIENRFRTIFGIEDAPRILMLSRLGNGKTPTSRAIRLSLDELTYKPEEFNK